MTRQLDLNRLRATILENQKEGAALPVAQQRKIVVDREGRIAVGGDARDVTGPVTEVVQDTFHAAGSRAVEEARVYLPAATRFDVVDGFEVFTYTVSTNFGTPVVLSAYFDGSNYQVKLVSPELEHAWMNPHIGHIFEDGRLCLSTDHGGGQPTLRQAFAKSVVWAEGVAAMLAGAPVFPYSMNNEHDDDTDDE